MKNKVSPLSITSLIVSILSITAFCFLFETTGAINYFFRLIWIVTGIASIILPIVSKWHRRKTGRMGKISEVLALIIGFFAFNFVLMYTTPINGSLISIIAVVFVVVYAKSFNSVYSPATDPQSQTSSVVIIPDSMIPDVSPAKGECTDSTEPIPANKPRNNPNQRFCKMCGGAIDSTSKKCTKCGKQYFHVKMLIKPLCILWALFTVCLLISVMFISRFAYQQTEKLHETEQLLNVQLESEEKYWTGYCEGNDVGYRNGYYNGIHEVLTEKQIFSRLYNQYQNAILDKSTLLDYDTWLEEQIGLYMSGYTDGFKMGQNDYTNGHSFSKSYGGYGRTNDRMNVSYIAGRVDGYNDGYANAAYPNN